jgi:hypothetical protein
MVFASLSFLHYIPFYYFYYGCKGVHCNITYLLSQAHWSFFLLPFCTSVKVRMTKENNDNVYTYLPKIVLLF